MTTENIRLRSEFLNTQVITRSTGKRLGVVKEILIDMDRREVVALGLRDNLLAVSGMTKYMYLNSIVQTGDVVLVENEEVIEDIDVEIFNKLVNCEVVTEANQPLGKVRDFQFDTETGKVAAITIASLGLPQIPEQFISTYELSIEDVVTSGPNRLIVFEGAEERITQVTVGILERMGIGSPPWARDDDSYYPPTIEPGKQLPTGVVERPPVPPVETKIPVREEERWDEDEWQEAQVVPPMKQEAQSVPYEELEEDNWGEAETDSDKVEETTFEPVVPIAKTEPADDYWDDDDSPQPYNPPPVNIPDKKIEKVPELEEETNNG